MGLVAKMVKSNLSYRNWIDLVSQSILIFLSTSIGKCRDQVFCKHFREPDSCKMNNLI